MHRPLLLTALCILLFASVPASGMPLGKTKLVSAGASGGPGGNGHSLANIGENYDQPMSADGRYVIFRSAATNLQTEVADTSGVSIFRGDIHTGDVQLVDVNAAGTAAASTVGFIPAVSGDGRYVFWSSNAHDLVAGFADMNGTGTDIYRRDMQTSTTTLVSRSTASPTQGSNGGSGFPVVTPDGRYVLNYSRATDLTSDSDTNNAYDLFRHDTQTGTAELVTKAPGGGTPASGAVNFYAMSPDGRYVVFAHNGMAADLVTGGTGGGTYNIYVRDMVAGTTELASPTMASATDAAGGVPVERPPFISDDGRYAVFESTAATLVTNDTNAVGDVLLRDLETNTTTALSTRASGDDTGNAPSTHPRMSADGRFVSFHSLATDLVASPADGAGQDIFRFDRVAGTLALVTVRADGTASTGLTAAEYSTISNDGRYVTFESAAGTLVGGFTDNNGGGHDIYKRDMVAGTTSLVSGANGSPVAGSNATSRDAWMTADGRFVTFASQATDIVTPGTLAGVANVYSRGNIPPQGVGIAVAAQSNPLAFAFTASGSDPDGTLTFGWLFGDGASATGATTSRTYESGGARTVTLTATDDDGESAAATTTVNPSAPPAGTPPPPPPPTTTGKRALPSLVGTTLRVDRKGRFRMRMSCPASGGACAGRVAVRTATAVAAAKRKRVLLLARTRYDVAAGKTASVRLRLNKKAHRYVKRRGTVRAKASFVAGDAKRSVNVKLRRR